MLAYGLSCLALNPVKYTSYDSHITRKKLNLEEIGVFLKLLLGTSNFPKVISFGEAEGECCQVKVGIRGGSPQTSAPAARHPSHGHFPSVPPGNKIY